MCLHFWNNFNKNNFKENTAKTATKVSRESDQFEIRNPLCHRLENGIHVEFESTPIQAQFSRSTSSGVPLFSWGEQRIIRIYFDYFEEPFHSVQLCTKIRLLRHLIGCKGSRSFRPMSCSPGVVSPGLRVDSPGVWSRFARGLKISPFLLHLLDLRIKRIKSSSTFFCDRSNDESNTNKQAKKVCECPSF